MRRKGEEMKFKTTWPDGREEVREQSDCTTVEQFINTRFGSGGCGEAKVTLVETSAPTVVKAKK